MSADPLPEASRALLADVVLDTGEGLRLHRGRFISLDRRPGPHVDAGEVAAAMVLPLTGGDRPRGVIFCSRGPGGWEFSDSDLDMALMFLGHVAAGHRGGRPPA